jgi:hypothetical protein
VGEVDHKGEVDLTLHIDPSTGKPAGADLEISREVTESGIEISAEVEVDEHCRPTASVGVKIPF